MPNEKFSDLAQSDSSLPRSPRETSEELSELRSELARLKQIMSTGREPSGVLIVITYKCGMTSDAEKESTCATRRVMTKGF